MRNQASVLLAILFTVFLWSCSGSKPLRGYIRDRVDVQNSVSDVEVYIAYADSQTAIAECYTKETGKFEFGEHQTKLADPDYKYKLFCKMEGLLSPTQLLDSSLTGKTIRRGLYEREEIYQVDFGAQIIGNLVDSTGKPIHAAGGNVSGWRGKIDLFSGADVIEPVKYDGSFSIPISSFLLQETKEKFSLLILCPNFRPRMVLDTTVKRGCRLDLKDIALDPFIGVVSDSLIKDEISKEKFRIKDSSGYR